MKEGNISGMYTVQVVRDNQLPAGMSRVLVEMAKGNPVLILTDSAVASWTPPKNRVDLQRMKERDDTLVLREVVTTDCAS